MCDEIGHSAMLVLGELGMGNALPVTAGLINRVVLRARPWLLQLYEN